MYRSHINTYVGLESIDGPLVAIYFNPESLIQGYLYLRIDNVKWQTVDLGRNLKIHQLLRRSRIVRSIQGDVPN